MQSNHCNALRPAGKAVRFVLEQFSLCKMPGLSKAKELIWLLLQFNAVNAFNPVNGSEVNWLKLQSRNCRFCNTLKGSDVKKFKAQLNVFKALTLLSDIDVS